MTPGPLLLLAALGTVAALAVAYRSRRVWLGSMLLSCVSGLAGAIVILSGTGDSPWTWAPAFAVCGERIGLRLDALSALFLALTCVVGGVGAIYGCE
jgi:formate hydrogenlyase subunit 3/multisubunit Na+/H+ antiporter MnhD subunit